MKLYSQMPRNQYYAQTKASLHGSANIFYVGAKVAVAGIADTLFVLPKVLLGTRNDVRPLTFPSFTSERSKPSLQDIGALGAVNRAAALILGAAVGLPCAVLGAAVGAMVGVMASGRSVKQTCLSGAISGIKIGAVALGFANAIGEAARVILLTVVLAAHHMVIVAGHVLTRGILDVIGTPIMAMFQIFEDSEGLIDLVDHKAFASLS